jgi:hypothetical protein
MPGAGLGYPSSPGTMSRVLRRKACVACCSSRPLFQTRQLSRQLSWSHFVLLLPLKDPLQREYYAQMCCAERWSVRTLRGRIDSMLYERTALSRQPDALIA